ncbi:MAG TPA: methionine--tRNA ligase subunit beta, partial [Flavitalea sp.]|nr:methionine--tRNA ligase subunit beta [Flavitalea sp.]
KGKVPPLHAALLDEKDQGLISEIAKAKLSIETSIEQYRFRDALFEVIDLARKGNRYMQEKQPWILAREIEEDPAKQQLIDNCLHLCLQLTANLAIFVNPFLPTTAKKILHMLKVVDKMLEWDNGGKIKLLSVGYSLRAPELLFRKIEDEEIVRQVEKLNSGKINTETVEEKKPDQHGTKPEIVFDDFGKIDLRTGIILSASKVEKADKLLKLEIDLGFEKRTIVSGIAMHFNPADIIGKQVIVVANLAPRKMRGIESNGMILMAETEGKLVFVQPDSAIPPGSAVS